MLTDAGSWPLSLLEEIEGGQGWRRDGRSDATPRGHRLRPRRACDGPRRLHSGGTGRHVPSIGVTSTSSTVVCAVVAPIVSLHSPNPRIVTGPVPPLFYSHFHSTPLLSSLRPPNSHLPPSLSSRTSYSSPSSAIVYSVDVSSLYMYRLSVHLNHHLLRLLANSTCTVISSPRSHTHSRAHTDPSLSSHRSQAVTRHLSWTPLHTLAACRQDEDLAETLTETLVRGKVDVDARDMYGMTALHVACKFVSLFSQIPPYWCWFCYTWSHWVSMSIIVVIVQPLCPTVR